MIWPVLRKRVALYFGSHEHESGFFPAICKPRRTHLFRDEVAFVVEISAVFEFLDPDGFLPSLSGGCRRRGRRDYVVVVFVVIFVLARLNSVGVETADREEKMTDCTINVPRPGQGTAIS